MVEKDLIINGNRRLKDLKVVELKVELENRGLTKYGTKKELLKRLAIFEESRQKSLLAKTKPEIPNQYLEEDSNLANDFIRDYFKSQKALLAEHIQLKKERGEPDDSATVVSPAAKEPPLDDAKPSCSRKASNKASNKNEQKALPEPSPATNRGVKLTIRTKCDTVTSSNLGRQSKNNAESKILSCSLQEDSPDGEEMEVYHRSRRKKHASGSSKRSLQRMEDGKKSFTRPLKIKIGDPPSDAQSLTAKKVSNSTTLLQKSYLSPQNAEVSSSVEEHAGSIVKTVPLKSPALSVEVEKIIETETNINLKSDIQAKPISKNIRPKNILVKPSQCKSKDPIDITRAVNKGPIQKTTSIKFSKANSSAKVEPAMSRRTLRKKITKPNLITPTVVASSRKNSTLSSSKLAPNSLKKCSQASKPYSDISMKVVEMKQNTRTRSDMFESLKQQIELPLHIEKFPSGEKIEVTSTSELSNQFMKPAIVEPISYDFKQMPMLDSQILVESHLGSDTIPDSRTSSERSPVDPLHISASDLNPQQQNITARTEYVQNICDDNGSILGKSKRDSYLMKNILKESEHSINCLSNVEDAGDKTAKICDPLCTEKLHVTLDDALVNRSKSKDPLTAGMKDSTVTSRNMGLKENNKGIPLAECRPEMLASSTEFSRNKSKGKIPEKEGIKMDILEAATLAADIDKSYGSRIEFSKDLIHPLADIKTVNLQGSGSGSELLNRAVGPDSKQWKLSRDASAAGSESLLLAEHSTVKTETVLCTKDVNIVKSEISTNVFSHRNLPDSFMTQKSHSSKATSHRDTLIEESNEKSIKPANISQENTNILKPSNPSVSLVQSDSALPMKEIKASISEPEHENTSIGATIEESRLPIPAAIPAVSKSFSPPHQDIQSETKPCEHKSEHISEVVSSPAKPSSTAETSTSSKPQLHASNKKLDNAPTQVMDDASSKDHHLPTSIMEDKNMCQSHIDIVSPATKLVGSRDEPHSEISSTIVPKETVKKILDYKSNPHTESDRATVKPSNSPSGHVEVEPIKALKDKTIPSQLEGKVAIKPDISHVQTDVSPTKVSEDKTVPPLDSKITVKPDILHVETDLSPPTKEQEVETISSKLDAKVPGISHVESDVVPPPKVSEGKTVSSQVDTKVTVKPDTSPVESNNTISSTKTLVSHLAGDTLLPKMDINQSYTSNQKETKAHAEVTIAIGSKFVPPSTSTPPTAGKSLLPLHEEISPDRKGLEGKSEPLSEGVATHVKPRINPTDADSVPQKKRAIVAGTLPPKNEKNEPHISKEKEMYVPREVTIDSKWLPISTSTSTESKILPPSVDSFPSEAKILECKSETLSEPVKTQIRPILLAKTDSVPPLKPTMPTIVTDILPLAKETDQHDSKQENSSPSQVVAKTSSKLLPISVSIPAETKSLQPPTIIVTSATKVLECKTEPLSECTKVQYKSPPTKSHSLSPTKPTISTEVAESLPPKKENQPCVPIREISSSKDAVTPSSQWRPVSTSIPADSKTLQLPANVLISESKILDCKIEPVSYCATAKSAISPAKMDSVPLIKPNISAVMTDTLPCQKEVCSPREAVRCSSQGLPGPTSTPTDCKTRPHIAIVTSKTNVLEHKIEPFSDYSKTHSTSAISPAKIDSVAPIKLNIPAVVTGIIPPKMEDDSPREAVRFSSQGLPVQTSTSPDCKTLPNLAIVTSKTNVLECKIEPLSDCSKTHSTSAISPAIIDSVPHIKLNISAVVTGTIPLKMEVDPPREAVMSRSQGLHVQTSTPTDCKTLPHLAIVSSKTKVLECKMEPLSDCAKAQSKFSISPAKIDSVPPIEPNISAVVTGTLPLKKEISSKREAVRSSSQGFPVPISTPTYCKNLHHLDIVTSKRKVLECKMEPLSECVQSKSVIPAKPHSVSPTKPTSSAVVAESLPHKKENLCLPKKELSSPKEAAKSDSKWLPVSTASATESKNMHPHNPGNVPSETKVLLCKTELQSECVEVHSKSVIPPATTPILSTTKPTSPSVVAESLPPKRENQHCIIKEEIRSPEGPVMPGPKWLPILKSIPTESKELHAPHVDNQSSEKNVSDCKIAFRESVKPLMETQTTPVKTDSKPLRIINPSISKPMEIISPPIKTDNVPQVQTSGLVGAMLAPKKEIQPCKPKQAETCTIPETVRSTSKWLPISTSTIEIKATCLPLAGSSEKVVLDCKSELLSDFTTSPKEVSQPCMFKQKENAVSEVTVSSGKKGLEWKAESTSGCAKVFTKFTISPIEAKFLPKAIQSHISKQKGNAPTELLVNTKSKIITLSTATEESKVLHCFAGNAKAEIRESVCKTELISGCDSASRRLKIPPTEASTLPLKEDIPHSSKQKEHNIPNQSSKWVPISISTPTENRRISKSHVVPSKTIVSKGIAEPKAECGKASSKQCIQPVIGDNSLPMKPTISLKQADTLPSKEIYAQSCTKRPKINFYMEEKTMEAIHKEHHNLNTPAPKPTSSTVDDHFAIGIDMRKEVHASKGDAEQTLSEIKDTLVLPSLPTVGAASVTISDAALNITVPSSVDTFICHNIDESSGKINLVEMGKHRRSKSSTDDHKKSKHDKEERSATREKSLNLTATKDDEELSNVSASVEISSNKLKMNIEEILRKNNHDKNPTADVSMTDPEEKKVHAKSGKRESGRDSHKRSKDKRRSRSRSSDKGEYKKHKKSSHGSDDTRDHSSRKSRRHGGLDVTMEEPGKVPDAVPSKENVDDVLEILLHPEPDLSEMSSQQKSMKKDDSEVKMGAGIQVEKVTTLPESNDDTLDIIFEPDSSLLEDDVTMDIVSPKAKLLVAEMKSKKEKPVMKDEETKVDEEKKENEPFKSARKVTVNRTKSKDESKKRKWGSTDSKSAMEISSFSLKSLVPDVKPLSPSELKLESESDSDSDVEIPRASATEKVNGRVDETAEPAALDEAVPRPKEERKRRHQSKEENDRDAKRDRQSRRDHDHRDDSRRRSHDKGSSRQSRSIQIVMSNAQSTTFGIPPSRYPSSPVITIGNLVRPFTIKQLKDLIQRTGTLTENGFWIDNIKSKCIAMFEEEDQAVETRIALHGIKWPSVNPKHLLVDFSNETELKKRLHETPHLNPIIVDDTKYERKKVDRPMREWDLAKVGERSPGERERERERQRRDRSQERTREHRKEHSPKPERPIAKKQVAIKSLDDLFAKTKTQPSVYWLPLTVAEIAEKEAMRRKKMAEQERREAEMKAAHERQRAERLKERQRRRERSRSAKRSRRSASPSRRRKSKSRSRSRS